MFPDYSPRPWTRHLHGLIHQTRNVGMRMFVFGKDFGNRHVSVARRCRADGGSMYLYIVWQFNAVRQSYTIQTSFYFFGASVTISHSELGEVPEGAVENEIHAYNDNEMFVVPRTQAEKKIVRAQMVQQHLQSGHSQVTVRSQSGLQSGRSQVLQNPTQIDILRFLKEKLYICIELALGTKCL